MDKARELRAKLREHQLDAALLTSVDVLYNSITREAYLVNISKRGVAIISSAYVSGYEL